ncbi:hypothetical protein HDV05_000100 [Chytridiales sp. JEL 0842]|nr:hypothetical protein HDV05_000100 [Chytridiales sp. JEL 0842]
MHNLQSFSNNNSLHIYDNLIIGAGISGLTAAYRLHHPHPPTNPSEPPAKPITNIKILEASSRIAGRIQTVNLGSKGHVDMGAQYVGPGQDHILNLLKELNMETYPQHTTGLEIHDPGTYSPKKGRWFSKLFPSTSKLKVYKGTIPPLNILSLIEIQFRLIHPLNTLASRLFSPLPRGAPPSAHLKQQKLRKKYDAIPLSTFARQRCLTSSARRALEVAVRLVLGVELEETSVLYLLMYIESAGSLEALLDTDGGAQERKVMGGCEGVCQKLLERVKVKTEANEDVDKVEFNVRVIKVEQDESSNIVRVSAIKSTPNLPPQLVQYHTKTVIVACPPTTYRSIQFNPPLPSPQRSLISKTFSGHYGKVVIVYQTPFWRSKGFSGGVLHTPPNIPPISSENTSIAELNPISCIFDACNPETTLSALAVFICASQNRRFFALPLEERRKVILKHLVRYFGSEAAEAQEYIEKNWADGEGEGGTVFGGPVDVLGCGAFEDGYVDCLKRPLGRVFFAGTETARRWIGYMSGGVEAAERAAFEVRKKAEESG